MKQAILCIALLLCIPNLWAGEHDWHLGISPTVLFNPHSKTIKYGTGISLEKQIAQRRAIEFGVLASVNPQDKEPVKNSEILFTGYYKPILSLGKNSYSLFKLGTNIGVGNQGLLFGVGAGFEYNIVLRNRIKIFIAQDNLLVFRGNDRFSMGLSLGLKLPL